MMKRRNDGLVQKKLCKFFGQFFLVFFSVFYFSSSAQEQKPHESIALEEQQTQISGKIYVVGDAFITIDTEVSTNIGSYDIVKISKKSKISITKKSPKLSQKIQNFETEIQKSKKKKASIDEQITKNNSPKTQFNILPTDSDCGITSERFSESAFAPNQNHNNFGKAIFKISHEQNFELIYQIRIYFCYTFSQKHYLSDSFSIRPPPYRFS